jgi:AraC-like DNA-binding protein
VASRLDPFTIRELVTDEHTEAESAVSGVPLQVDRLSTSTAPARFVQLGLGDVSVVAGDYGGPIHSRGVVDAHHALVGLQMNACPGHWNGHTFQQNAAWIYGPGAEHDGVGLQPTYFAVVGLPAPLADALCDDTLPGGQTQVSIGAHTQSLRGVITSLLELSLVTAPPSSRLASPMAASARAALLDSLASVLRLGGSPTRLDTGAAAHLVDQCIQATADLGPQPSPLDLSALTGLTDRRIRAAFNEQFGVPVATYFRRRALHAAHRDLVAAQPDQTTVAAVATRWGFWHLGRFAQQYRDQFGVHPRTTLNSSH